MLNKQTSPTCFMKTKTKTFFEELQSNTKIDKRDNRGQRHELALILVELVCALLSNRDGNQSSILRHMAKHHDKLVAELGLEGIAPKKQYRGLIFQEY